MLKRHRKRPNGPHAAAPQSPARVPGWVDAAVLLAIGLGMLAFTWRGWADPLVDFGRELYVPWRLATGDRLFTDIAWFNGPLSQYWNAALFRVFGPGLSVLAASNAAVLAVTVTLLYGLTRPVWGRLAATSAGAAGLTVFAFGQYLSTANFNWITPYSHELTHGIALALVAVAAMGHWARGGRTASLVVAGLSLGMAFLTKPEPFAAGLAGVGVFLPTLARVGGARAALVLLTSALFPVAVSWGLLGAHATVGGWPAVLAGEVSTLPFYRSGMGIDRPWLRLGMMLAWSALWTGAAGALFVIARATRHTDGRVAPLAVATIILTTPLLFPDPWAWLGALRPLPLATLGVAVGLATRVFRGRGRAGTLDALALAVFGLVLLAKRLLNASAAHYGFALALPATCVVTAAALAWLPSVADRFGGRSDVIRAGLLALLTVFAFQHVAITARWHAIKTEQLGVGADAMKTDPRGAVVRRAIDRVGLPDPASLAVLPEGVMINYLTRVPAPTQYINFMPPEEILFGDAAWAAAFATSPPDVILSVPKDVSEYGRGPFGIGYGVELYEWIAARYGSSEVLRMENISFEIDVLLPLTSVDGP